MVGLHNIDGSPEWQTAVFLVGGAFILVNTLRGWAIGLMRQIIGIIAFCVACYCVLTFTGRIEEFLGPHLPAVILTGVSVLLIWIISFNVITLMGRLLFKRTRDCDSGLVQLIYGFGGAVIGTAYGLVVVFVVCGVVRIVGRIAADQVAAQNLSNSPVIRRISQNPRILDLERDPSIVEATQRGDLLSILANPKVIALLRDPEVRGMLSQPEIETVSDRYR
jgi:colicin V production protein